MTFYGCDRCHAGMSRDDAGRTTPWTSLHAPVGVRWDAADLETEMAYL